MQFQINLAAGQRMRQQTAGRLFVIISTGAAPSVAVTLWNGNTPLEEISTAGRGFKARVEEPSFMGFTHVDLVAPVDCAVQVVISNGLVDFDTISGATVNAVLDRGAPANPLYVAGLTYADAPASSMANIAPVAVAAAAVQLVPSNAARKALRLANIGAAPVAIGAAGITWAGRCIVLQPGDVWIEERGHNLAWFGICETATSSITGHEVMA